jgi:hypothetical protein
MIIWMIGGLYRVAFFYLSARDLETPYLDPKFQLLYDSRQLRPRKHL